MRDNLEPGEAFCQSCERRAARFVCHNPVGKKDSHAGHGGAASLYAAAEADDGHLHDVDGSGAPVDKNACRHRACEACFECVHKPACDAALALLQTTRALEAAAKEASRAAKDRTGALLAAMHLHELQQKCVACEEPADQKCLQCGDFYCSKTWMGNPGCFVKYHARGRRAEHQSVSLESLKPVVVPGGAAAWASKKAPRPN